MAKLIITDSYFNSFNVLINQLKNSANLLSGKNIVFCEEKSSLMIERKICSAFNGTFNTDVYSFGNYLRLKKPIKNLLSKEGSTMVVKRILATVDLKCFRANKTNLATTLFEQIIQLKSAKISPLDLVKAVENSKGILKSKLQDILTIYTAYENFVMENGFIDQSSFLAYLPKLLEESQEISDANVYLIGFDGWTNQIRTAILTLLNKAKSVTAILTGGENEWLYVNETIKSFKQLCLTAGVPLSIEQADKSLCQSASIIASTLFNPTLKKQLKINNSKVYYGAFSDTYQEIERIGQIIKSSVLEGENRYRDFTIALQDVSLYRDRIKQVFTSLEIPFYIDEQKKALSHPLVTLILSYANAIRRNLERQAVLDFLKNPLFCKDKKLTDVFENYIIKYNVNYGKIKESFSCEPIDGVELEKLEQLRVKLCESLSTFNIRKLLVDLNVEQKLTEFTSELANIGEKEESALNEQIYEAISKVIAEIDMILGGSPLSIAEYVNVFLSGVQTLELSIIPQYNDAVFIGAYKECSLVQAKELFAVGLTSNVPNVKLDVALLSDDDIDALQNIKILIEPKIRIVNHRARENLGMALSAFSKNLYLSYPVSTVEGKKQDRSEILNALEEMFELLPFPKESGYLTKSQGLYTFARDIGWFAENKTNNIINACSYFNAIGKDELKPLLDNANKEVKERIDGNRSVLLGGDAAPTVIEDYYKCPYRAFVSHVLKLRDREEGNVNALSVGNFMHEILKRFIDQMDRVQGESSALVSFEEIIQKVLALPEYSRYYADKTTATTMDRIIQECKKYCLKTYSYLKNSDFKNIKTEQAFGYGKEYPCIPLLNGKVRLSGKIDRIDFSDKYFRVVDYKTGTTDISNEALFTGNKLQLYLYAKAVKEKEGNENKKIAGLYYLPITDKYEKQEDKTEFTADGKTLDLEEALSAQGEEFVPTTKTGKIRNGVSEGVLDQLINYAVALSEKAVERMDEGVIIPSPYQGVCQYCEYGSFCSFNGQERKVGKVSETTLITAILKGGEEDAVNR